MQFTAILQDKSLADHKYTYVNLELSAEKSAIRFTSQYQNPIPIISK